MQIAPLIKLASQRLADSSDSPRLDAELLLGMVLRKSRAQIYSCSNDEISAADQALFAELLEKRRNHLPIAHITGRREFWTLNLKVTPDTLVPRPETELLVEQALARIPEESSARVLDLGTGSGAAILAIGSERPNCPLYATDISREALEVAAENGACSKQQVNWYEGDWFAALTGEAPMRKFDIIVSNPPYIGIEESGLIDPELQFEPDIALYSGDDGLSAIRAIIQTAPEHLNAEGWLLLEHGFTQGEAIRALLADHNFVEISTMLDLAGRPRVTSGRMAATAH